LAAARSNFVASAAGRLVGGDVRLALQRVELGRGEPVDHVDLTLLEGVHRGLDVLEDQQLQLVDLRGAAPVTLVGLELQVLVLLVLGELVGPVADADHRQVVGLRVVQVLDRRPHVLGHDRHIEQVHTGLHGFGLDHQCAVVGRGDALEVGDVVAVRGARGLVGEHPVERERRVLGGDRPAVGPLRVLPDLERPGQLVRRGRPRLGQSGRGLGLVGGRDGQELVDEPADLGGRRE
jgi:hypothetical protein